MAKRLVQYADGDSEEWPLSLEQMEAGKVAADARSLGSSRQKPSYLFPGLKAQPVWSRSAFPLVVQCLEEAAVALREEALGLLAAADADLDLGADEEDTDDEEEPRLKRRRRTSAGVCWQPQSEGLHSGVWLKLELWAKGGPVPLSSGEAPRLAEAVKRAMESGEAMAEPPGRAALSLMLPGVCVRPHCGPTNHRLRLHLPLLLPGGALEATGLSVASEDLTWHRDRCLIFDDSFEHEVRLQPSVQPAESLAQEARLVLLMDLWHPEAEAHGLRQSRPA